MAKISLDYEGIKSELKTRALNAKTQLTGLAELAKKDLAERGVLKKVDQVIDIVKSQEFMKNPKVADLAKKIVVMSEQIEKIVTENANQVLGQVRARMNKENGSTAAPAQEAKAEKAEKAEKAPKKTAKKNA